MDNVNVKHYKELDDVQQKLYINLADVIQQWNKEHFPGHIIGIKKIFEVMVTLTLSVKALYLINIKADGTAKERTMEQNNDLSTQIGPRDTEIPTDSNWQIRKYS